MAIKDDCKPPIDILDEALLEKVGVTVGLLRLDLIHPLISGNKWYKLKENIALAQHSGYSSLLTFGGAWSNHLVATAAAAPTFGMKSVGIVRGEELQYKPSASLQQCMALGMQLVFLNRSDYARKDEPDFLSRLHTDFPAAYIIPEGGNNEAGRKGAEEIARFIPPDTTHVALAIGTGTTFSGIRNAVREEVAMFGFPAIKGGQYLEEEIRQHLKNRDGNFRLSHDFHFGGFGKYDQALVSFMNDFHKQHKIPLDVVYTAKMMYGLFHLIEAGAFEPGSKIIAIHTGGLQGNRSISHLLDYAEF